METGGRLGRSSTRYGAPPPPFNGPVKKWKKKWVDIPKPNSNNNNSHSNGGNSGNNISHLVLYKWTPISSSSNSNSSGANLSKPATSGGSLKHKESEKNSMEEEPPRRKFRYVPVTVVDDQKLDGSAKTDDDSKLIDVDTSPNVQNNIADGKSVMNDVSMEDAEVSNKDQVATETSLDLNLGLKADDGKHETIQN
ncbi:hypothetical protein ZOSMA_132G00140 [Zostera marina]|uniref:Uncharacterized protein n=1 Tax=Zostera marina TaxID=29655 RepID=A0A0K9PZ05_ZOSMR|nr:hypothetical protein ZOSMA_132G00140 [Zostera marina]